MSLKVGGFTPQEYNSYLNTGLTARNWKSTHWISVFNFAYYPIISVLINRLSYFILHQYTTFPNNAYLFGRFKVHDFNGLATEQQCDAAIGILNLFKECAGINPDELARVESELETVKGRFSEPSVSGDEETPSGLSEEGDDGLEDSTPSTTKEEPPVPVAVSTPKTTTLPQPPPPQPQRQPPSVILPAPQTQPQPQAVPTPQGEDKISGQKEKQAETDVSGGQEDAQPHAPPRPQTEPEQTTQGASQPLPQPLPQPAELQIPAAPTAPHAPVLEEEGDEDVEDFLPDEDVEDVPLTVPEDGSPLLQSQTEQALRPLFNSILGLPVPEEVKRQLPPESVIQLKDIKQSLRDILNRGFVLRDDQTLNDLSKDQLDKYHAGLELLCEFERKFLRSGRQPANEEVKDLINQINAYLLNANDAFDRTFRVLDSRVVANLYQSFKRHFEAPISYQKVSEAGNHLLETSYDRRNQVLPELLLPSGEVRCTSEQLDWVVAEIRLKFPALYKVAFEASSLDIDQGRRMAIIAKLILCGASAGRSATPSAACIRLRETEDKYTEVLEKSGENNPFTKEDSYIFTLFAGLGWKRKGTKELFKQKLREMASSFVNSWFIQKKTTLILPGTTIYSGQSNEAVKAEDWIVHVRDAYTAYLKGLSQEQLFQLVKDTFDCPFVKGAIMAYQNDIPAEAWTTSQFPAALMEQIFENELRFSSDDDVRDAIKKTIDHAAFANPDDLTTIAQTAGCLNGFIEPLIRIRVMYLMTCLGHASVDAQIRGADKRVSKAYDPDVNHSLNEPYLRGQPEGSCTIQLDVSLDALLIQAKAVFKEDNARPAGAQAQSLLQVSSISKASAADVNTKLIEMKDLKFGVYATKSQKVHIAAQVEPVKLTHYMKALESDILQSPLVAKANRIKQAKENHESSRTTVGWLTSFVVNVNPFDSQPFFDAGADKAELDLLLRKISSYPSFLRTIQQLKNSGQLDKIDHTSLDKHMKNIQGLLEHVQSMIKTVYTRERLRDASANAKEERESLVKSIASFETLLRIKERMDELDDSESDSEGSPIQSPRNRRVIGYNIENEPQVYGASLYRNTLGYATSESRDPKDITWKIERYEKLIQGAIDNITNYIEKTKFDIINSDNPYDHLWALSYAADYPDAPEWLKKLNPIIKLCESSIRKGTARITPEYLETVRKTYTDELIRPLREAAEWAKEHPNMPGVEHVDAIWYAIYTALNLNEHFDSIFSTFIKRGEEELQGKKWLSRFDIPNDPKYKLIRDLLDDYDKIRAVPNSAKAPILNKLANSLVGHLGGVVAIKPFDPTVQSNPMHVQYKTVIRVPASDETEGKTHEVKELAFGTPTIENGYGPAVINPEFQAYLRECKRLNETHLYINHQTLIPRSMLSMEDNAILEGDESSRCQALHDLADKEFKGTLTVVTFGQHSWFYKQEGHELNTLAVQQVKEQIIQQFMDGKTKAFAEYIPESMKMREDIQALMTSIADRLHRDEFSNLKAFQDKSMRDLFVLRYHQELRRELEAQLINDEKLGYTIYDSSAVRFKEEAVAKLFDGKPELTGNLIPQDLPGRAELRAWAVHASDVMHEKLFGNRAELTVLEKRIFIRMLEGHVKRKIIIETKPSNTNETCKDKADRAQSAQGEEVAYRAIINGCMNYPGVIKFLRVLMFMRALVVRKREIIFHHLERMLETVKFMLDNQELLIKVHDELFPGIDITIDQFPSAQDLAGAGLLD